MASRKFGSKTGKKPHLARGSGGVQAEVTDLRNDIEEAFAQSEAEQALTTAQRTALGGPTLPEGTVVWDTDLDTLFVWDGAAWELISAGGTVDPSTATNNSNTTGVTVDSDTTGVTVDSDTTGLTVDNETATNNDATMAHHETFLAPEAPTTAKGSIDENAASDSPSGQPTHPVTLDVTFPAAWSGGTVRISGTSADGAPTFEDYVDGSAGAGGTELGTVAFALIDSPGGITNDAPGGAGGNLATVGVGVNLGVASRTAATFYKLSVDGLSETISASDPTQRTFEPAQVPDGVKNYEVWYTNDHGHTQNAHNHAVTDAGHTHGVTDAGHTHGVTDAGHNHTQNSHTHPVS